MNRIIVFIFVLICSGCASDKEKSISASDIDYMEQELKLSLIKIAENLTVIGEIETYVLKNPAVTYSRKIFEYSEGWSEVLDLPQELAEGYYHLGGEQVEISSDGNFVIFRLLSEMTVDKKGGGKSFSIYLTRTNTYMHKLTLESCNNYEKKRACKYENVNDDWTLTYIIKVIE